MYFSHTFVEVQCFNTLALLAGYHLCLGIWDLLAYFHKNMAGSCRNDCIKRKGMRFMPLLTLETKLRIR